MAIVRYAKIADIEHQFNSFSHQEWYKPYLEQRGSEKRRQEFTSAMVLLKEITGTEPHIAYTEENKPYLIDSPFKITISHSKEYVCVAASETCNVGIDIEAVAPRIDNLAQRYMTPDEYEVFRQLQTNNSNTTNQLGNAREYATAVWCAKEAIFKIVGNAAADFPANIQIQSNPSDFYGIVIPYNKRIELEQLTAPPGHIIILAHD